MSFCLFVSAFLTEALWTSRKTRSLAASHAVIGPRMARSGPISNSNCNYTEFTHGCSQFHLVRFLSLCLLCFEFVAWPSENPGVFSLEVERRDVAA